MKKFFPILLLLALIGGLGYISFSDVDISQAEKTVEISNDRFFETN